MNEGAPGRPSDVYSRYGVQRHAEVQTGQEVQDRVTAEVQGRYGPFLGMVMQLVLNSVPTASAFALTCASSSSVSRPLASSSLCIRRMGSFAAQSSSSLASR